MSNNTERRRVEYINCTRRCQIFRTAIVKFKSQPGKLDGMKYIDYLFFTRCSELRKVLFLAPSVCGFLFVYEISRKSLNGFAPNSHGRRVWSLAQTRRSLKVKVKDQRLMSPERACSLCLVKHL